MPAAAQVLGTASAVAFGTRRWTALEGLLQPAEQVRALEVALDLGCSLVDIGPAGSSDGSTAAVESVVGDVLAHRLRDVTVVASTAADTRATLARVVRRAAGRLRRDRLDVLLLELPAAGDGPVEDVLVEAFAACEALVDHGELGCYGVTSGAAGTGAFPGLGRLLELAQRVRREHRFGVVQLPCDVLTGGADGGGPALVRRARRDGLVTLGTRPMPVWPASGVAPLATCQKYLLDGIDHVVVEAVREEQVRALATLLPARWPKPRPGAAMRLPRPRMASS